MLRSIANTFSLVVVTLLLNPSCATSKIESSKTDNSVKRPSSKVVYSLITKDSIGLESTFSKELKSKVSGDFILKAFSSVEKNKDDMEAIEFIGSTGKVDTYVIFLKNGRADLKFQFNSNNQLDQVWIDGVMLKN